MISSTAMRPALAPPSSSDRTQPLEIPREAAHSPTLPPIRTVVSPTVHLYGYSSPFIEACSNGNLKQIICLLKSGTVNPQEANIYGLTPLMAAAARGQAKTVGFLLKNSFNTNDYVNRRNHNGHTALMLAARKGDLNTVEILCRYGAKLLKRNEAGKTARDIATENRHHEVVNFLKWKEATAHLSRNLTWAHPEPLNSAPELSGAPDFRSASLPALPRKISALHALLAKPDAPSATEADTANEAEKAPQKKVRFQLSDEGPSSPPSPPAYLLEPPSPPSYLLEPEPPVIHPGPPVCQPVASIFSFLRNFIFPAPQPLPPQPPVSEHSGGWNG